MTNSTEIWVVDDDSSIRWVIEKALSGEDIPSKTFECADDLLAALETHTPKAIIVLLLFLFIFYLLGSDGGW